MTEEQLLSNWIPHDHVWGESGPVPVELGGVSSSLGNKSVWKADLVIDDSAATVLLKILRSDAKAGFSNSEEQSPVYRNTRDLLVRIIGRERLGIFERDIHRLPSWIDYDERYFARCDYCEYNWYSERGTLVPTGWAMYGKAHLCDDCEHQREHQREVEEDEERREKEAEEAWREKEAEEARQGEEALQKEWRKWRWMDEF